MTDNVIQLDSKRPHLSGTTICLACGHTGGGSVAPVGVCWMECEKCGSMKCIFANPVVCADPVWHCNCSCIFFTMGVSGSQCANCGTVLTF